MKFTRIKSGYSENRRVPMLGRIRLGIKVKKVKDGGQEVEFPRETKHFVCPQEVQDVYGPEPTELDVMFLSDKEEDVFPQSLVWFGKSKGLKCQGNMEEAERLDEATGEWKPMKCPCPNYKSESNPKGECTESGILKPILPKVSMGGTYFIKTGSYNSMVDVNSGLEYIRALIGRISMVPLKLRRVARDTHSDGKKQVHYTLSLTLDANVEGVNQLRHDTSRVLETAKLIQIEGPEPTNPHMDEADVVEVEAEDISKMDDAELAGLQAKLQERQAMKSLPYKKPLPTGAEMLAKMEAKDKAQGDGCSQASTPGCDQKPTDAPAPPQKPSQAAPQTANETKANRTKGNGLIQPDAWKSIIMDIDMNPDWATLKLDWKTENKVDNVMKLTAGGQAHFLGYMREKIGEAFQYPK